MNQMLLKLSNEIKWNIAKESRSIIDLFVHFAQFSGGNKSFVIDQTKRLLNLNTDAYVNLKAHELKVIAFIKQ